MEQAKEPKLVDQLYARCRLLNRSPKTADVYWHWCERFLRFQYARVGRWVHPRNMGRLEIESFLTHLATKLNVAPSTQNQAFNGILFLYREVLKIEVQGVNALRAKKPQYIPTVLSVHEVSELFHQLTGRNKLIASLCYGCGMRIGEVFELRVKDIDFGNRVIHIRQAKGHKDRIVQLPDCLIGDLQRQIEDSERLHDIDIADGCARVPLPFALDRKCPRAASEISWYWLFCSQQRSREPGTGRIGRFHIDESTFSRALAEAVRRARIRKRVTSHCLRHSYATHLMNSRVPLVQIKELLGHESLETTQIYLHVEQDGAASVRSPLDALSKLG